MSGICTVTVSSEGKIIDQEYPLLSIEINYQINKIPYAELIYYDVDNYSGQFKLSNDERFKPGKSIKINMRYEEDTSSEKTIFEGLITKHQIKYAKDVSQLILELRHTAINLTLTRKNTIFLNKTEREIFNEICKGCVNVNFQFDSNGEKHRQMIQYGCSNWDFILSRTENNGWWLICDINDQLKLIDPVNTSNLPQSKVILDLNAGSHIYSLSMTMDIINQVDSISAKSWDVDKQEVITEELSIEQKLDFIKLKSNNNYAFWHCGDITKNELKTWTRSKQIKNDFSVLRGKIKIPGELNIKPGMMINLKNLSPYFNGNHVVSSVKHNVDENGFETEIGIGLPVDSLIEMYNVDSPLAGGMLPSIQGLHIGVVKGYDEIADNDKNLLLVKVKLPLFDRKDNEIWARLTSIYAGQEYGVVFRPEIGNEVALGFFNNDPRYPVILGSMYSAKNKPPIQFNKENDQKAIVTKNKIKILLKDKIKSIELTASDESKCIITAEGDSSGIVLKDARKNSLLFNADGISCTSSKDIKINTKKAAIIDAAKVEVN